MGGSFGVGDICGSVGVKDHAQCNEISVCKCDSMVCKCVLSWWFILSIVLIVLFIVGLILCCVLRALGCCCNWFLVTNNNVQWNWFCCLIKWLLVNKGGCEKYINTKHY